MDWTVAAPLDGSALAHTIPGDDPRERRMARG